MQTGDIELLARDFGRQLTTELAPAEAPFFDELVDAHQRPRRSRRDHKLAFGVSAEGGVIAVALYEIGKVALQAIWVAIQPILSGLADDAAKQFRESFGKKLKKWIDSRLSDPPPVSLKPEAFSALMQSVSKIASEQGLDEKQSAQIIEALGKSFRGNV